MGKTIDRNLTEILNKNENKNIGNVNDKELQRLKNIL